MRVELLELHLFLTQFIDIKFSLTYCLVHIVCLSLRLLLLLEHHKNILNIFQCNELPALLKCGRSCIPLLGPGFLKKWRIIADNYPQYPYTIWWHVFCKSRYCFVEGIDITFWFLPIIFADLVFWEKFVNFKFVQTLNSRSFSYGIHETQTQNLLIPRTNHFWNLIIFALETCCFLLGIQGFWIWVSYFLWLVFVLILLFWAWWSF